MNMTVNIPPLVREMTFWSLLCSWKLKLAELSRHGIVVKHAIHLVTRQFEAGEKDFKCDYMFM